MFSQITYAYKMPKAPKDSVKNILYFHIKPPAFPAKTSDVFFYHYTEPKYNNKN